MIDCYSLCHRTHFRVYLQVIVNEDNLHDTRDFLTRRLEAVKNSRNAGDYEELALVIGEGFISSLPIGQLLTFSSSGADGKSLGFALEKDLSKIFLELAVMCKAVVCCKLRRF